MIHTIRIYRFLIIKIEKRKIFESSNRTSIKSIIDKIKHQKMFWTNYRLGTQTEVGCGSSFVQSQDGSWVVDVWWKYRKNVCKKQKYVSIYDLQENIVQTFQITEVYQSKSVTQYFYFHFRQLCIGFYYFFASLFVCIGLIIVLCKNKHRA